MSWEWQLRDLTTAHWTIGAVAAHSTAPNDQIGVQEPRAQDHDVFQPHEDHAHPGRLPAWDACWACQTCSRRPAAWLPWRTVHLGLDLRGGSYLLLEVDMKAVLKERLDSLADGVRQALRNGQIFYQTLEPQPDQNRVLLRLRDATKTDAAVAAMKPLIGQDASTGRPDTVIGSDPDGTITLTLSRACARGKGCRRGRSNPSRSSAAASTKPVWSIPRSPARAKAASSCSFPASATPTASNS